MRSGRRFNSPRQRHQQTESTMTTGFMQNISPKAANTRQCSLIPPQSAAETESQLRLQKWIPTRDSITISFLSKQTAILHWPWGDNSHHWGVWTSGISQKNKSQVRNKPPVPSNLLGPSHSYSQGGSPCTQKPVVASLEPHEHGSYTKQEFRATKIFGSPKDVVFWSKTTSSLACTGSSFPQQRQVWDWEHWCGEKGDLSVAVWSLQESTSAILAEKQGVT